MRPRGSEFYVVEETVAALHEELLFTLNYARAMVQDRNYRAAADVIEEQRRSLVRATARMEKAVARETPAARKPRVRAALVGVAAVFALATGAFAAFGPSPREPAPHPDVQRVRQAAQALSAATTISDPVTLQAIVGDAENTILEIAQSASTNPDLKLSLLDSVQKLQLAVENPNVPATVRRHAKKVAATVQQIVSDVSEPAEQSTAPQPSEPSAPETEADSSSPVSSNGSH